MAEYGWRIGPDDFTAFAGLLTEEDRKKAEKRGDILPGGRIPQEGDEKLLEAPPQVGIPAGRTALGFIKSDWIPEQFYRDTSGFLKGLFFGGEKEYKAPEGATEEYDTVMQRLRQQEAQALAAKEATEAANIAARGITTGGADTEITYPGVGPFKGEFPEDTTNFPSSREAGQELREALANSYPLRRQEPEPSEQFLGVLTGAAQGAASIPAGPGQAGAILAALGGGAGQAWAKSEAEERAREDLYQDQVRQFRLQEAQVNFQLKQQYEQEDFLQSRALYESAMRKYTDLYQKYRDSLSNVNMTVSPGTNQMILWDRTNGSVKTFTLNHNLQLLEFIKALGGGRGSRTDKMKMLVGPMNDIDLLDLPDDKLYLPYLTAHTIMVSNYAGLTDKFRELAMERDPSLERNKLGAQKDAEVNLQNAVFSLMVSWAMNNPDKAYNFYSRALNPDQFGPQVLPDDFSIR